MPNLNIFLDESQRQATVLALAHLAVERPGWNAMLTEIAAKMDNTKPGGDLELFTIFKDTCDRKAQADKLKTPHAAGICKGLAIGGRFKFDQQEIDALNHASEILTKVAGVSVNFEAKKK